MAMLDSDRHNSNNTMTMNNILHRTIPADGTTPIDIMLVSSNPLLVS